MRLTTSPRGTAVPVLLLAAAVSWTTATAGAQSPTNAEQQVKALHEQLVQAVIKGDKDDSARYVDDTAALVTPAGQLMTKREWLDRLPLPLKSVDIDRVLPVGSASTILVGTAHYTDGSDVRYMQQWLSRNGQWQLVAHEATRVEPVATGATMAAAPSGTAAPTGTSGRSVVPSSESRTIAPSVSSREERAVWKVQADLLDAWGKGDVKKYLQLTSDDFQRIEAGGKVYSRSEWVDVLRKNINQPTKAPTVSDVRIKVTDDTAWATMELVPYTADGNAQPAQLQTRYFAKRNGRWQQVAAVATAIGR